MKLDFIDMEDEGAENNQFIRLFDFDCSEVTRVHGSVLELANGSLDEIAVHELPYVRAAKIRLILKPANKDFGIRRAAMSTFACELTRSSWLSLAGYMEPFLTTCDHNSFQWLDESFSWTTHTSDIGFLFSPCPNGQW